MSGVRETTTISCSGCVVQTIFAIRQGIVRKAFIGARCECLAISLTKDVLSVAPDSFSLSTANLSFIEVCWHAVHSSLVHVDVVNFKRVEGVIRTLWLDHLGSC